MTLTIELADAYERKYGQRPAEPVFETAEHILKVGKMLKDLGQKDARNGKPPRPANVFPALAREVFHSVPEEATTKEIADLWRSDYMDGYEDGNVK